MDIYKTKMIFLKLIEKIKCYKIVINKMTLQVGEQNFKLPLENVLIVKFTVGFPVKLNAPRVKDDLRNVESYIIMLSKVGNHWHTYNNSFISYGRGVASEFAKNIQRAYDNANLDAEVVMNNDIIDSKMPTVLEEYLDKMIEHEGIVIEQTVLRELDSAYFVFYFTNDNYEFIGKNTLQLLFSLNGIGEIIYLGPMNYKNNTPFYYNFLKEKGLNLSNFRLIKTVWEFKGNEIEEKVEGLFTNKGIFYPKFFGSEKVNLYLIQNRDEKIKKGNCRKIEEGNGIRILECKENSDWFNDFFNNIVSKKVGPVTMWWESDGSKVLQNNYIVYDKSSMNFLLGLKELFEMEKRRNHRNILISNKILKDIETT